MARYGEVSGIGPCQWQRLSDQLGCLAIGPTKALAFNWILIRGLGPGITCEERQAKILKNY